MSLWIVEKSCALAASGAGRAPEQCDHGCPFWQDGGDDLGGGCAVERLGLDRLGVDVAEFLLDVRGRLA